MRDKVLAVEIVIHPLLINSIKQVETFIVLVSSAKMNICQRDGTNQKSYERRITMKYGVGIDVSKGKSTIAILSTDGEIIKEPFEINHNILDFNNLDNLLSSYSKNDLKIIMEDTGTYHLPILNFLLEKNYFVKSQNPFLVKKFFDRSIRKAKTDRKDSYKLAEYACDNWKTLDRTRENDKIYEKLKFLSRQYLTIISTQTDQKVNFSNLCDIIFPGYYQLLDDRYFTFGLEVFKKYYHPEIVKNKTLAQLTNDISKIAKKLGHLRIGISFAKKLYNLAQTTYSPSPNDNYIQLAATSCVEPLITTISASVSIITEMNILSSNLPEYSIINSIPGCGNKLTPLIIAEIGDIRRFKNAGSIIAYARFRCSTLSIRKVWVTT